MCGGINPENGPDGTRARHRRPSSPADEARPGCRTDGNRAPQNATREPVRWLFGVTISALQSSDARGAAGTVYAGFDGIDRPIWRNTSNSPSGAYDTYSYDSTANGNVGIDRLTSETFLGVPNNSLSGSDSYVYDARGK